MDKNQKAIRSLIEHHLIYSHDSRERKNLIDIYHIQDGTQETKPEPTKSENGMGIIYLGMTGIVFALTLLAHLINQ